MENMRKEDVGAGRGGVVFDCVFRAGHEARHTLLPFIHLEFGEARAMKSARYRCAPVRFRGRSKRKRHSRMAWAKKINGVGDDRPVQTP